MSEIIVTICKTCGADKVAHRYLIRNKAIPKHNYVPTKEKVKA